MAAPDKKQKLVLICAAAGYGKTTLMAQIARDHAGYKVWYQVDRFDNDPAVFLRNMIIGISQACNGIGSQSLSRLDDATDIAREGKSIIAVLNNELSNGLNEPLAICFDDLHLLDESKYSTEFINYLISDLPDKCSVYISSRTKPNLPLGRIRVQGNLKTLEDNDLQFSKKELKELVSETWRFDIASAILEELHLNIEGWVAGLVLVEDILRIGDNVPEMFTKHRVRKNVYEYLQEEVMSRQSEAVQDVLAKCALMDPIDPHISKSVLNIENAPAILSYASKSNMFISRVDDSNLFRFHPLFRDFLLTQLNERVTQREIVELRTLIGKALEINGENGQAVEQYIQSNKWKEATSLFEQIADSMLKNGEYMTMTRWLNVLPQPLPLSLEYFRGKLLLLTGKPNESLALLNSIKGRINTNEPELFCSIRSAIAECYLVIGEPRKGIMEVAPLLENNLSVALRMKILHRLSTCYWEDYDDDHLSNCFNEANKLVDHLSLSPVLTKIEGISAGKYLRSGCFPDARKALENVAYAANIDVSSRNLYMNNLASCTMLLGEYKQAAELIEKIISRALGHKEEKWLPVLYDTYGCIISARGNEHDGKKYIKKAINLVETMNMNKAEVCPPTCHLGTIARRKGDYVLATLKHSDCLRIAEVSGSHYDIAMSMINIAADYVRQDKSDAAIEYFNKAFKLASDRDFGYVHTQIDFQRAWQFHECRDQDMEIKHLKLALKRARKHQHNHFIIQEGKICLPLFSTALLFDIETEYVYSMLKQIGKPANAVIESLLGSTRKDVKLRCGRLLEQIADPKAIALARRFVRDKDAEISKLGSAAIIAMRNQLNVMSDVLTTREIQVMELIAQGSSNHNIATQFYISERTVKTHVTNIFRKLGVSNRIEAAILFRNKVDQPKYDLPSLEIQPGDDL
ncbi:MAG: LuxR C-terminal-related transcriptional regulator [Thermoleophilia bacterium]